MVKHREENDELYTTPGGGIEKGETPEQAAIRELQEECNVLGTIIKKTSEFVDPYDSDNYFYTFHIDIGEQTPSLGHDPEIIENPILTGVRWMALDELSERDRAFLWAAGLLGISSFFEELTSWNREISYPGKARASKLHIMIDCDNVLNNVSEDWVMYLNKKHDLSVNPQNLSHEQIYEAFPTLSKDEINFPLQDEAFGMSYTVKPDSYEYLKKMLDDGHELTIVTAHSNRTAGVKFEWITKHFPFISRDDIIIARKKGKVIGDVLIDDEVRNLIGGDYLKILFDHPNNRGYDAEANGMIRVHSLKEAYEVIQGGAH